MTKSTTIQQKNKKKKKRSLDLALLRVPAVKAKLSMINFVSF